MGCGKSTLGKKIAEELKMNFIDSDKWIEETSGKKIPEIFKQEGELHFRKMEVEFIKFARSLKNTVVATGAGLPCMHDHMQQLNEMGTTVWLDVDENILAERLSSDPTPRPMLANFPTIKEAVHSLLQNRREFYEQAILQIKNPTAESLIPIVKNIL